ncbi:hypothetical protein D2L64_23895 [Micromonospora radicis]|uniref:Uncharacterized protein n=1 Tax=Micromonospora radicis TaxID=1894971 RepID=A0A418MNZ4_9ACTN|nr:hypothetical protein D2L64_23895 [Micromonospora radicis]
MAPPTPPAASQAAWFPNPVGAGEGAAGFGAGFAGDGGAACGLGAGLGPGVGSVGGLTFLVGVGVGSGLGVGVGSGVGVGLGLGVGVGVGVGLGFGVDVRSFGPVSGGGEPGLLNSFEKNEPRASGPIPSSAPSEPIAALAPSRLVSNFGRVPMSICMRCTIRSSSTSIATLMSWASVTAYRIRFNRLRISSCITSRATAMARNGPVGSSQENAAAIIMSSIIWIAPPMIISLAYCTSMPRFRWVSANSLAVFTAVGR